MDGAVERLLAVAATAEARGDAAAAGRAWKAVLAAAPDHPQALNALGLRALYSGEAPAAAALLTRATAADPGAAMLWLNLSSAHRAVGDDDGERAALAAAIDLDPYALPALIRKAQLHERLGEEAQALAAWRIFLDAAPPAGQPPQLRVVTDHAAAFVAARTARFADALETGLAAARARFDGAERRRFDAGVDHALGRRALYTRHCAGLEFPFLPADEFLPEAMFPWFGALQAQTGAIRDELLALLADRDGVIPYVDLPAGARPNKWSELSRTTRWGAYYFRRFGASVAAAAARCPATAAAIAAVPQVDIPGRAPTAFFSLLEPRTRIPPHTGVTNTRVTVHLPLVVPPGCGFRVGGETRSWVSGTAFAFDDTIEHEAWNDGEAVRAVLILDTWNPYLTLAERALVQAFYAVADATGLNPEPADAA